MPGVTVIVFLSTAVPFLIDCSCSRYIHNVKMCTTAADTHLTISHCDKPLYAPEWSLSGAGDDVVVVVEEYDEDEMVV